MFCKLAVKNAAKSYRDYSVYFLTLAFGVCLFYTFNALDSQWAMVKLGESRHYMVETIMTVIAVFSAFVSVVLACLVVYANGFLMKRRKKELGTYLLLGLPTGKVSLLLVLETLVIGVFALGAGLLLGLLASQGLGLLTVAMFAVAPAELTLVFSVPALLKTVLYFGGIFLAVMVFTSVSVSRAKLLDLMQVKNEEMAERPLWVSVVLFLVGAALLATAYALLLSNGFIIGPIFFTMLALGTLGTLLFFRSLSGFVLRAVKGRPGLYYKGLNMFVLRQFNARIHTTYLSMTVVCLLLLLAIGITACSVGLNSTIEGMTTGTSPYDLTMMNYNFQGKAGEADLDDRLRAVGLDPNDFSTARHTYRLYYNDPAVTGIAEETAYAAIALSDYNASIALLGGGALALADSRPVLAEALVMNSTVGGVAVVSDDMTSGLELRRQVANYIYRGDKLETDALVQAALTQPALREDGDIQAYSHLDTYWDNMGSKILVLFLGLYLGILFLLTAAAVLALQQLSQAADNVPRYAILSRLGASQSLRDRSVFLQVLLAFAVPLALAVVHAVVGMTAANQLIAQVGKLDVAASSFFTAGMLLLIYGAYFAATCLASRRVARESTGGQ